MMRWRAALFVALLGLFGAAVAQEYPPPQTIRLPDPAHWFAGLSLIDQDGRKVQLYDELMARQIVIVNGFYAHCRASCPTVMNAIALLREKMAIDGIDASFISITVDPENDTPEMLQLYATGLGAKPGWHLLSGDPVAVRQALHKFGLDVDLNDPDDHLNVLYIANLRTGIWKKVFSLTPADALVRIIDAVSNDDHARDD
jgi:protein SCO1/2